ncbi:MAG: hypothetical protein KatS3mg105_4295 [Gemmatales bacterium]|nr:MAG: hypothetical protein KatS3mg105_4295 [Gemmatales bacterium]
MPQLLVSVRQPGEVENAIVGGADVIDVKEPLRGSLGRADDEVIGEVVRQVAGRRRVSAALGELIDDLPMPSEELAFVKWGLAGCAGMAWQDWLVKRAESLPASCRPVAVAYADWHRAGAPSPEAVYAFAQEHRWSVLLIDTWQKDGTSLLDWLDREYLTTYCQWCRAASIRIALAGSLGPRTMQELWGARPDWFAVRTAVCDRGDRVGWIRSQRVAELKSLLSDAERMVLIDKAPLE